MEPITTNVSYMSDGKEDDLKVFGSLLNNAKIDINAQYASQSMFTTPKTKYANEGFQSRIGKLETLSIIALILVILLYAFRGK
jgi:hypothetical protein